MARKKTTTKNTEESYEAKDIYVLEGLDPVRKRPGMYIGSTGPEGLHHLIWECVDNSLDEAMAGYAKNIEIALLPENRVRTKDDGRGIPVDKHPQTKKSALETVLTTLHAGAKFGGKAYQVAGGLHGVGVSVVCALSKWMRAEVCRGGFEFAQEYSKGKPKTGVKKIGKCKKTGTTIIFEPDQEIFKEIKFDLKKILTHLRQQAYLTSGVRIKILDGREKEKTQEYNFYFDGGLSSYVKHLIRGSAVRHPNVFYCKGEKEDILVEAAFQYTEEYEVFEESFANNINTGEGGTHLTGFRGALTRAFNDYARREGYLKETEDNLTGDDIREGLTGVVSVKIKEPQFEGQTKAKLGNPEAKVAVENVVSEGLIDYLERNPQDARAIVEKCILTAKARKAAKAAKLTVLRKGALDGLALPGKLADCASKKPEESELYIVEGDSAGGCLAGDTKVALVDGRNITFKEIIKEEKTGKKHYCYTIQTDGSIGIERIMNPRITKKSVEVMKIILDNNGEITCTPDHRFMLRDGSYKMAKDLTPEDSLMPFYCQISKIGGRITIEGYELVFNPTENKWIFTHLLANKYNLTKGVYSKEFGNTIHHLDFNKLNNNPDNLIRMPKDEHLEYHTKFLEKTLHREDIKEKCKKIHQTDKHREKIRKIMTTPKMRRLLSRRAKKQWQDGNYKNYMIQKFLEFYHNNNKYQESNRRLLYEAQKKYWTNKRNRTKQAKRVKNYFINHPEKRIWLSEIAKKQWVDLDLRKWRSERTKKQWTPEFRKKRKKAYNKTYLMKAIEVLYNIYVEKKFVNREIYNRIRKLKNDKTLIKYDTICQRFFGGDEEKLKEAVINYNHRIKEVIPLKKKVDVYDLEVPGTHNFALASGIFVHNSAKQARDRRFQAILPLRGKILNVERARLDKILAFKEIKSLIIAMGTAVAEDFDINNARYHRIILMADADSDGNHIRTLLLTLFYRYFKPIIEAGYLYIAQPPLYRIQAGKRLEYAYTDSDKEEILADIRKGPSFAKATDSKGKKKDKEALPSEAPSEGEEQRMEKIAGATIQRYKGLGEMNPEQLWETTMDPANRVLLKVTIENGKEADKIFDILMGDEVLPRKKFIQTHAKKVKNLDI